MRVETHCQDRKLLAQAISEWIHEPVHYDGVPRCSYSVGPFKVERDASITCDDPDAWATLMPFLQNHGWLPTEETEAEHEEATQEEAAAEETPAEENVTEETTAEDIRLHSVSIPLIEFTVESAANLLRMVHARQDLLNAMTRGDTLFVDEEVMNLLRDTPPSSMDELRALVDSETAIGMLKGISVTDGKLTMDFPFDAERSTDWQHYAKLMFTLADRAKSAHRVNTKRIQPSDTEMKYFCNSLLNQLGFGGAEHKELRHVLLGHLHGYAAFRTADKMEEHKTRFTERRRMLRQQREEKHDEAD